MPQDFAPDGTDDANGLGERISPTVIDVTASTPQWMQWPGKWGGADSSPSAPPHQGKWLDPFAFEDDALSCTPIPASLTGGEQHLLDAGSSQPPAPVVTARRDGSYVIVNYRFKSAPGLPKPWVLITTLDSLSDKYSPTDKRTFINGRTSGRVRQKVYLARGPLRIMASARSRNGSRSKIVIVNVK